MTAKKNTAAKRQAWNKGLLVGQRDGFTPVQVKRIRGALGDRGVSGLRDLALFSVAIDTMLRGAANRPKWEDRAVHRNGSRWSPNAG
jgi:hypothetical protein